MWKSSKVAELTDDILSNQSGSKTFFLNFISPHVSMSRCTCTLGIFTGLFEWN